METKTAVEIAKEVFEALNRRDYARMADSLADDVSLTSVAGITLKGRDAVMAYAKRNETEMPDFHFEVVDILSGESKAGVEYVFTGTQSVEVDMGPGFGKVLPTGKRVTVPGFWVITVKDGKVTSIAQYLDMLGMLTQVGLLPAPALAPA